MLVKNKEFYSFISIGTIQIKITLGIVLRNFKVYIKRFFNSHI